MTNVFAFCIYGNNIKYNKGLIENIEIISKIYPDFQVWIVGGNDVNKEWIDKYTSFENVRYHTENLSGGELMTYRFFLLDKDDVDFFFIRDADSRIEERDQWCIDQFLKSGKTLHIIRDHYHHRRLIMGGMWGIHKKENLNLRDFYNSWKHNNFNKIGTYRSDQDFIDDTIYQIYKNDCLIHSNLIGYSGETISPILIDMKNDKDFIGNVYEYTNEGEKYLSFSYKGFNYKELAYWLNIQNQPILYKNALNFSNIY